MINVEKYENIDYLASKKILELIIILAVSDDNLHISERKFIFDLATKLNIKKEEAELILDKIIEIQKNNKNYLWSLTDELVEYFYDNELRYFILETLSNLAKQDLIMHKNEISFLKIVSKKWKIKAVFSENISWDSTQKKIINSNFNERIAVSAGPGTGKTAIACARVSSIVDEGLPSSSIMMLSFTRTAIRELSDRIANFISSDNNPSNLRITTIDSQAWSILYGFSDEEVEMVVNYLKENGEPKYLDDVLVDTGGASAPIPGLEPLADSEGDELYDQGVSIVTESRRASISYLQRRLKIGYNRAASMIEDMEKAGVVSEVQSNGTREVLAPPPVKD